jgi:hypothetical protein
MMMRRSLFPVLAATLLLAPLAAAQEPAQQGKLDSASAAAAAAAALAQGKADGQAAAATVGTESWYFGGFLSGLLVGLIGTGVSYALAASSGVELPPERRLLVSSQAAPYQQAYEKAYVGKVKSKRKSNALTGGLLGTATFLTIYFSIVNNNSY